MKLRIIKVNQENFSISVDQHLWGRKKAGFKNWEKGDHLLFIVENRVAALAQVSGEPFYSEDIYWSDDLYPHRIPFKAIKIFKGKDQLDYLSHIKPVLLDEWGNNFGWQILTQQFMSGSNAEKIIKMLP